MLVDGMRQAARVAAANGLTLGLEPLHRNVYSTWSTIGTLPETIDLMDEIGEPNVKVLFDVYHLWDTDDVLEHIARHGDRISPSIHICDWRADTRNDFDRALPGEGVMDLPALFGALDAAGAIEWVDLEIFSDDGSFTDQDFHDSLWKQDPADVIARGEGRLRGRLGGPQGARLTSAGARSRPIEDEEIGPRRAGRWPSMSEGTRSWGDEVTWEPVRPRLRPARLVIAWITAAVALMIAALIVPGVEVAGFWGALFVAALIGILNAIVMPILAAVRLPFTVALGFMLVLVVDALLVLGASELSDNAIEVESFWRALLVSLVTSAAAVALQTIFGTDDDDEYALRVTERIARRSGGQIRTDVPGIIYLEIDGLALPVLKRAMRDGNCPNMARWVEQGTHVLAEWETDLSSQTGASQAGILLGSNEDIPAFRWVEKETGRLMTCSAPEDCAELERRHSTGIGLLIDGGASRGNLLSGDAEHTHPDGQPHLRREAREPGLPRVLRQRLQRHARAGAVRLGGRAGVRRGRARAAPRRAAARPPQRPLPVHARRDVRRRARPDRVRRAGRRHEGPPGDLRDVLELRRGRPPLRAGARRHAGGAAQARRADRPHRPRPPLRAAAVRGHRPLRPRPDAGRDLQAAQRLRARRPRAGAPRRAAASARSPTGDENASMVGHAIGEATGHARARPKKEKNRVTGDGALVLGSGNLGLIYLLEEPRRLTMEEIDARHPALLPALRAHPHVGWLLVRSEEHGAVALGGSGTHYLAEGRVEGDDPLAAFSPNAPRHLLRTDGFPHVADIMVGSFYDPMLDQGCAFEELISFHGGLGGPQTRPFVLAPAGLPLPEEPIVGAAAVHGLLAGWRALLQGGAGYCRAIAICIRSSGVIRWSRSSAASSTSSCTQRTRPENALASGR